MYRFARILMIAAVAVPALAQAPDAVVRLRIRAEATVAAAPATLADVLVFPEGADKLRQQIGAQPVSADESNVSRMSLTHQQIEKRLYDLGADLGQVLLYGASQCDIRVDDATAADAAQANPVIRETPLRSTANGTSKQTLEAQICDLVTKEMGELGGSAEVGFEQAARPLLELTSPQFDFVIHPQGHEKLGLREFRVIVRRDGKTQRSVSVFGRVRLSKRVLVAQQPLNVGSFISRDDIVAETRLFDRLSDVGCDTLEEVIGQQIAQFVPKGDMLTRSALKSVELVRRSRPVTVMGLGNNVSIRTTGMALDSGSYGDTVRVRLGDQRGSRDVVRALVTGVGAVRVLEGA